MSAPTESESESGSAPSGTPRGIAARLFQLLGTRLELLGFELDEERRASLLLLGLAAGGATFALLAVVALTVAVVLAFPPDRRWMAAVALGLAYGGVAAALLLRVRRILRERPRPFAATLEELRRDREWLKNLK